MAAVILFAIFIIYLYGFASRETWYFDEDGSQIPRNLWLISNGKIYTGR